ncbi:hypothetical protein [Scytonema sp. PCC 10023]|uniref:hypothetical protein n=1 Tax=Scytonema sp. PCC 10023 TaxID=1680591 RepID=UPI0039C75EF6
MEVYLNTELDLDSAINQAWRNSTERNEQIKARQEAALAEALQVLANQFQQDLNEVLSSELQNALNIKINQSFNLDEISADFEFMEYPFSIFRVWTGDEMSWRIIRSGSEVTDCQFDNLKNQLLTELAKIKNASNTNANANA